MNTITLLGRTTSTIELKQTPSGKSVASFSLAVKRPHVKDTTDFINIVCWDKQAELLSRYVRKGDQVCIRGYLTVRAWNDQQGNKRYTTEVVADEVSFVGKKEAENSTSYIPDAYKGKTEYEEVGNADGLPF